MIVVFPDHTHLLFWTSNYFVLCTNVNKKCYYRRLYGCIDIYGCESCMVLAHDEVHVLNVVNEDKTCCIQIVGCI